jgi:2,3-bisphosphoglycerate-dependent phosphoglycerate mutase
MKGKLILIRHAESVWNKENRFSGESDTGLTPKGIEQSIKAADELKAKNIDYQIAFSSNQKRAVDTLNIMMKHANKNVPVIITKELRETELGVFNGENIDELKEKYGEDMVFGVDNELDVKAPEKEGTLPSESLRDLSIRAGKFHDEHILKHIEKGKNAILIAHDGTCKSLLFYLGFFTEEELRITEFENAKPYIYEYKEGDLNENRSF